MDPIIATALTVAGGVATVSWWVIRRTSGKLDDMTRQLGKLDGVADTIRNLESLVKDELRHFDVRITRLEAQSDMRLPRAP